MSGNWAIGSAERDQAGERDDDRDDQRQARPVDEGRGEHRFRPFQPQAAPTARHCSPVIRMDSGLSRPGQAPRSPDCCPLPDGCGRRTGSGRALARGRWSRGRTPSRHRSRTDRARRGLPGRSRDSRSTDPGARPSPRGRTIAPSSAKVAADAGRAVATPTRNRPTNLSRCITTSPARRSMLPSRDGLPCDEDPDLAQAAVGVVQDLGADLVALRCRCWTYASYTRRAAPVRVSGQPASKLFIARP